MDGRAIRILCQQLAPGGTYVCEDVHGGANAFAAYVASHFIVAKQENYSYGPGQFSGRPTLYDRSSTMNQFTHPQTSQHLNDVQRSIYGISFYPYMIVIEKLLHPRSRLDGFVFKGEPRRVG